MRIGPLDARDLSHEAYRFAAVELGAKRVMSDRRLSLCEKCRHYQQARFDLHGGSPATRIVVAEKYESPLGRMLGAGLWAKARNRLLIYTIIAPRPHIARPLWIKAVLGTTRAKAAEYARILFDGRGRVNEALTACQ
jgi:hypothetical protein